MRSVLPLLTGGALAVLGFACGGGSGPTGEAMPAGATPSEAAPPANLAGIWSGAGLDSNANTGVGSKTAVTWSLTQTDAAVSGTVTTQSSDAPGTTCNSCHRSRTGKLTGTVTAGTLTWTISFPADGASDPTPACLATFSGTVSVAGMAETSLSGSYAGDDSCEGQFSGGTLTITRLQ